MATGQAPQMSPQQVAQDNINRRNLVLATAVEMRQQIFSKGFNPTSGNVVNVPINNVGLVTGFLVKVEGTITNTNGAAVALTRTALGASNVLSQIVFTDLTNTVRIQTTGWHLGLINSAKQPLVFGGAYAPNVPVGYGSNWAVQVAPATIAAGADAAVQFYYHVPLAYSKQDLRGAMYAGVVNATSQLQLTINSAPVVASGDATLAVYSGTTGGWKTGTEVTITVYQIYLDQLPMGNNGVAILPPVDLSTIYELKNVSIPGLVVSQDLPIPYANFRTFLSTCAIFDNGGTLNTGSDVNYWAMRAANTTSLFQYGPEEAALYARSTFMADPPAGVYYFDHRDRPISTQQFGNMQLVLNPSTVNSNAAVLVGFEDFAMVNQVQFASSLPGAN